MARTVRILILLKRIPRHYHSAEVNWLWTEAQHAGSDHEEDFPCTWSVGEPALTPLHLRTAAGGWGSTRRGSHAPQAGRGKQVAVLALVLSTMNIYSNTERFLQMGDVFYKGTMTLSYVWACYRGRATNPNASFRTGSKTKSKILALVWAGIYFTGKFYAPY